MDKTKVILDTNVLVSALGWKGKPHRILELVVNGEVELFMSLAHFEEFWTIQNSDSPMNKNQDSRR